MVTVRDGSQREVVVAGDVLRLLQFGAAQRLLLARVLTSLHEDFLGGSC